MQYYSPFNIFSENQISNLTADKLDGAEAQFSDFLNSQPNNEVKIKGQKIDAPFANKLFEQLRTDFDLHLAIYKNSSLLSLLETGSLDFFKDKFAMETVLNDEQNKDNINIWIAKVLDQRIPKQLDLLETSSHQTLSSIYAYTQSMDVPEQKIAYRGAKDSIKRYIDYLNKTHNTPFASNFAKVYDPQVALQVSDVFYGLFDVLPADFEPLKKEYAKWCNNMVVRPTLRRDQSYKTFPLGTQTTLAKAANIAGDYYDIHDNKDIVDSVNQKNFPQKGKSNSKKWVPYLAILGILALIGIGYKGYKDGSSASEPTESKSEKPQKINKELKELATMYSGDDLDISNPILQKTEDNNNETILYYDVDVLPTNPEGLDYLIPIEQIDKYKAANRMYRLLFSDSSNPIAKVEHKIDIEFSDETNESFVNYNKRIDQENEKNTVSVKSMRSTDFPLDVVFTRQSTKDNSIEGRLMYTIDYDKKAKEYTISQSAGSPIRIKKDELLDNIFSDKDDDKTRKFKIIINSLDLPNKKYLKERNFYTLSLVPMYSINNPGSPGQFKEITENKAYLKYDYTSDADNTAYCLLKGKDYYINYYVNHDSGKIKGMQITNVSADTKIIERVLIYPKNN